MELFATSKDCRAKGVVPYFRTYRLASSFCGYILRCLVGAALLVTFPANAGLLNHSFAIVPTGTDVNLTLDGPIDWIHWGTFTEFAPDRKTGGQNLISDFTALGNGDGPFQYADNYNGYTWDDGQQHEHISYTTTGVYKLAKNNGFQFTVPADTTPRVLKVYVGTYGAKGSFQASLSDGSAPGYSSPNAESVDNQGNGPGGVYTLTYAANSANKFLTVTYTVSQLHDNKVGNVTLQAATLSLAAPSNNPPVVWIDGPATSSTFPSPSDILIEASAFDSDGIVTNVEFFAAGNKLGESSASPYSFTWSNAPPGNFQVIARATDDMGAVHDSSPLELFGYTTNGTMAASYLLPATVVSLTTNGTHDWVHWGLVTSNSFDHKALVPQQIGNFTRIGPNVVRRLTNDRTQWSWNDGTPTSSANNSATAAFIFGYTNGFSFSLPADTNVRTARFYLGVSAARGKFRAALSDLSAPVFTDNSLENLYKSSSRMFSLTYAAASPNQTLQVSYTADAAYDSTFANVILSSASLDSTVPLAILTSPTGGSLGIEPIDISFSAQALDLNGAVVRVEYFEGTNRLGEASTAPYSFVWSNVMHGAYSLTVKATDNDGVSGVSLPVTVAVVTNVLPVVSVTSPANGQKFIEGDRVNIAVQANGVDDGIRTVEAFVNNLSLGQLTNTPYSFVLTNPAAGSYSLSAVATDQHGALGTSAPIAIIVVTNNWPAVAITNPISGKAFFTPVDIGISASASDTDGTVRLVEFFRDGIKLGQRTNSPYTFVWTNAPRGRFTLTANATDDRGGLGVSAPVIISVSNSPPLVALTNPLTGSWAFEGTNIYLAASASDADGTVAQVEFYQGHTKLGEANSSPWTLIWSNVVLGSYQLSAFATDNEGAAAASIPVSLNVISNQTPSIAFISPTNGQIFFRGSDLPLQTTAQDPDGFITRVEYFAENLRLGEGVNPPFSLVWSNLPAGTFSLKAIAYDNWRGSNSSDGLTVYVTNAPPSISLTNPPNRSWFFEGTNVCLAAQVSDPDGAIAKVEFFAGTNKLEELTNSPWTVTWSNVVAGSYEITVVATDNDGAASVSEPVSISVVTNQFPSITLVNPKDGQIFSRAENIPLQTTATDNDGFIARVEFFEGANKLGETTNAPFSFSWTAAQLGTFSLTAVAYDNWTGSSTSSVVTIGVSNALPLVALTNPPAGAWFFEGTNVCLNAEASDPDGAIVSVSFFEGTNQLALLTNAPWSFTWSNMMIGAYQLLAVATDNDGATSVSDPVSITVVSNQQPTVSLSKPMEAQVFFRPSNITIEALPADVDGFISRVEFFEGANKLGETTNTQFSFVWSNAPLGTFSLTAVAYDNWTGSSTSSVVTISVSNALPLVALTNPPAGAWFFEGTNVCFNAQTSDPDGAIVSVSFFEGTNQLALLTNAPWSFTWSNVMIGAYQLLAVATDNDGATSVSDPVSITVVSNQQPTVSLSKPMEAQVFFRPSDILIEALPADVDGFISRVDFFEGANKLGETTNTQFSFVWSNAPLGTFSLTAVAYDNWTGSSTSSVVTFTISNQPPSIALVNPTNGQVFFRPADILFETLASDVDGTVSRVEFYQGTIRLGESTNAPFSFTWSNAPLGTFELTAVANDDSGGKSMSNPISIEVTRILPVITLSQPSRVSGNLVFSFLTRADWNYTVESTTSPSSAQWLPVTHITGDGNMVFVTNDLSSASNKFYRVVAQ